MANALRTIAHEERLSLVDHLTELRTRLMVCAIALAIAFGLCFWQNHELLHILNRPLGIQTLKQIKKGNGSLGQSYITNQALLGVVKTDAQLFRSLAAAPGISAGAAADLRAAALANVVAVRKVPTHAVLDKPVTLGVGEPFTTTITVSLYFAFILALPVILFELYGFLLPAFSPNEKRVALPLMSAIPFLFVCGVAFGYFIVVPAAVRFFQNFNNTQFNVLVQAAPYYRFIGIILLAMGLIFQVPVAVLAATRAGIVTPKQLKHNRRYAIVACAAIAAFLPGDAITLMLETVPLYVLFEVSILLASIMVARDAKRERAAAAGGGDGPAAPGAPPARAIIETELSNMTCHDDNLFS